MLRGPEILVSHLTAEQGDNEGLRDWEPPTHILQKGGSSKREMSPMLQGKLDDQQDRDLSWQIAQLVEVKPHQVPKSNSEER